MNTLLALNNLGSIIEDVADTRLATVIFDQDLRYYTDLDRVVVYDSNVQTVAPNINIEEIINYATALVRYRVSVITGGDVPLLGSTVDFGTLPPGITLEQSGEIFTLSGIPSSYEWNLIKTFTWTMPVNYTTATLLYLKIEIIYYDEALAQDQIVDWFYYDELYFETARLNTAFDLQLTAKKILGTTINLASWFTFQPEIRRIVGLNATNLSTVLSLVAQGEPTSFVNSSSQFALTALSSKISKASAVMSTTFTQAAVDTSLKLQLNLEIPRTTTPFFWSGSGDALKFSKDGLILHFVTYDTNNPTYRASNKFTLNADKTAVTNTSANVSWNDPGGVMQLHTNFSGDCLTISSFSTVRSSINGTEISQSGISNYLPGRRAYISSNSGSNAIGTGQGFRTYTDQIENSHYLRIVRISDNVIVRSFIDTTPIESAIEYDQTNNRYWLCYETTNGLLNLRSSTDSFLSNQTLSVVNVGQRVCMDTTATYIAAGVTNISQFVPGIRVWKRTGTTWSLMGQYSLGDMPVGYWDIKRIMISENGRRICVILLLDASYYRAIFLDLQNNQYVLQPNPIYFFKKNWASDVGDIILRPNYNSYGMLFDVSNDGRYLALGYASTENPPVDKLQIWKIL